MYLLCYHQNCELHLEIREGANLYIVKGGYKCGHLVKFMGRGREAE